MVRPDVFGISISVLCKSDFPSRLNPVLSVYVKALRCVTIPPDSAGALPHFFIWENDCDRNPGTRGYQKGRLYPYG